MKTTFYINITSGIRGPEAELTEEQSEAICKLAEQLTQPWTGSTFHGMGLGPDKYMVHWCRKDSPITAVRVDSSGYVSMWRLGDTDWHDYTDTVGLWASLAPIGSAAYQKWLKDARDAIDGVPVIFKIEQS